MAELSESQIRVALLVGGFILGFASSYFLYGRGRQGREKLSILQLGSVLLFFGYMASSFLTGTDASDIVLTAILGIFGGETIGRVVGEAKGDPDDKKKD